MQEKENQKPEEEKQDKETLVYKKLEQVFMEYHLSGLQATAAQVFFQSKIADPSNSRVDHVRQWMLNKINGVKHPKGFHEKQRGCPDMVPGLRSQAFWDTSEFEWVKQLEDNYPIIKEELLALRSHSGFQPYRAPSWTNDLKADDQVGNHGNDKGNWNVFYLFLHDMKFEDNCERCPKTVEIIEKIVPREYHHAFFSALTPKSHIVPHNGPTNKKLRLHLPMIGVSKSRIRVGDQIVEQEEGKALIFDDSYNHEAWHDGDSTRILLILDLWHPDLNNEEVKFFKMLQHSRLKGERKFSQMMKNQDTFFSIIERSKDLLKGNDDWWIG